MALCYHRPASWLKVYPAGESLGSLELLIFFLPHLHSQLARLACINSRTVGAWRSIQKSLCIYPFSAGQWLSLPDELSGWKWAHTANHTCCDMMQKCSGSWCSLWRWFGRVTLVLMMFVSSILWKKLMGYMLITGILIPTYRKLISLLTVGQQMDISLWQDFWTFAFQLK